MVVELAKFKDWTIDPRLKQFRMVEYDENHSPIGMKFVEFNSEEGRAIFKEYCDECDEHYNEISSDYRRLSMQLEEEDIDMDTLEMLADEMENGTQ